MKPLMRTAVGLTCLLVVTACGSGTTNTPGAESGPTDTSGLVEPGFRTVLRVDLRPGTSGDDSAALSEKYSGSSGVQESRGGGTDPLFIFTPDATAEEIAALRQALSDESSVKQVDVEHRK